MSSFNFAVYAEGCIYPPTAPVNQPVPTTIAQLQQSGFNSVLISLLHVVGNQNSQESAGDIHFNDTPIIVSGKYVGDPQWPALVNTMAGGTLKNVLMSLGGGGVSDYTNIAAIYAANGNSFANTNLQQNFATLRATFPMVAAIDLDCEDNYDSPSFIAFAQMLVQLGFGVTFCPYTFESFWTGALSALNASNPGAVKWWNLQCYAGGTGNDPSQWAAAIRQAIPGFDTDDYILASDWTNDSPAQVQALFGSFKGEASVGGGFMWTLDDMITQNPSDPQAQMTSYVDAMSVGLGNVLISGKATLAAAQTVQRPIP
ncbi:hypothetical protein [Tahibacter amnicola]|uniref:Glycosyl hydrolase family 18 (Putative chitinase) n=1 Tax=Tahibacter amnicola TaxID=2976241 RepID=A0ABY6BNE4_9GAMM|nr:hypothetical protein [Tahibacter amnicola]UXI70580.1 hypothetical protein N4264_13340 [Tahibacter amnicola]